MRSDYEQFVTEQAPVLLRLAFVLTGDRHRAEDLTQTTLLDAHRRWRRVSGARHPDAYVRRMLVNAHVEWHRRRSASEVPTDLEPERTAALAPDHADAVASRDEVRTMLAGLPSRARTVLVLRYLADVDDAEIADMLGISASTVRATATRALATLRGRAHPALEEER